MTDTLPSAMISFTASSLLVVIIFQVQQRHPLPLGDGILPQLFYHFTEGAVLGSGDGFT